MNLCKRASPTALRHGNRAIGGYVDRLRIGEPLRRVWTLWQDQRQARMAVDALDRPDDPSHATTPGGMVPPSGSKLNDSPLMRSRPPYFLRFSASSRRCEEN